MSWQGKAIGGSIGSFFGPWGTLAGAAAGHFFVDRKAPPSEKQSLRLLAITAGALCDLAGIDGRYSVKEDQVIRAILAEINRNAGTSLAPHELAFLIDDAARINRCLARLATMVRENPNLSRAAVVWLWRVAVSDGDETSAETACIASFARHAGLSEDEARHLSLFYTRQASSLPASQTRRDACSVLGIPYHADPAQIKAAYRSLSLTYHPDKHAGLDPAIRALTAEKFSQVKAAYDTLCGEINHDWHARRADSGQLAPATVETVVSCFFCRQKTGLPSLVEQIPSARCPACQTLLVFERVLAEQLV